MRIGWWASLAGAVLFCVVMQTRAEEPGPPPPPEFKVQVAPDDAGDKPLAEVDQIIVKAKDVWGLEKAILEMFKKRDASFVPSPQDRVGLRQQLAQARLGIAVLQHLAADYKAEVPDEELDQRMKNIQEALKARNVSFEDFALGKGCATVDEFRQVTRAGMALEHALAKEIPEDEVKKAFEQHSEGLPLRKCSHVLYGFQGAPSVNATRTKEEAKKLADETLAKIKADKDLDFAQLAKECSDCPSRERGGDLDFSPRKGEGQMVDAFASALYALPEVGAYSDVVETDFGYHIIKLTEIHGIKDFEPVIRQQMAQQKIGQLIQQKMGENQANLKMDQELMMMLPAGEKLPEAPAPDAPAPKTVGGE